MEKIDLSEFIGKDVSEIISLSIIFPSMLRVQEMRIIKSINFNYFEIKVFSIENNYPEERSFYNFLKEKNFVYFDNFGVDEIYYNKKYFNSKSF